VRYATTTSPPPSVGWTIDTKAEAEYGTRKLEVHPEIVSAGSTTHPIFGEVGAPQEREKDVDMGASLKADMRTIRDTFDLSGVPRQAYYMGLAGVLPYLATSLGTVFCAYEINHAHAFGTGTFMTQSTAETLLHILQPLQIGYGAVILSFLGAIHWGLEWAGYGGYHGYRRYAIGVVAPAVAWPTLLLPTTYALIGQFFAFNFLYNADAKAAAQGWAPPWYSTYRFVLTFIVGASIVVSLIGHGEIADKVQAVKSPVERIQGMGETMDQQFRAEEAARAERFAALQSHDSGSEESESDSASSDSGGDTSEGGDEQQSDDRGGEGDESKDASGSDKQ
jgi:hypothetical protein